MDSLTPPEEHVRQRMQGQKRAGTVPELALRRRLHAQGFRYRVGYRVPGLPRRTIDIAFPGSKVAVFVDGCFWHRCPDHYVPSASNSAWWAAKLDGNVSRDLDTTQHLAKSGWTVVRLWEHENPDDMVASVLAALRVSRPSR